MKKQFYFECRGGLGRLSQFPKTVTVQAENKQNAAWAAMSEIRKLITHEDFKEDPKNPMLSKIVNVYSVILIDDNAERYDDVEKTQYMMKGDDYDIASEAEENRIAECDDAFDRKKGR